jgi:hypothetical protein
VIVEVENTAFRKLDLFPSSGEGRLTPTLLGPLERAKTTQVIGGYRKVTFACIQNPE